MVVLAARITLQKEKQTSGGGMNLYIKIRDGLSRSSLLSVVHGVSMWQRARAMVPAGMVTLGRMALHTFVATESIHPCKLFATLSAIAERSVLEMDGLVS